MKVFKVPRQQQKDKEHKPTKLNKIIGVIDASGSMQSAWPHVATFWNNYVPLDNAYTITFDQDVHACPTNILDSNISKHGGGMTNISKAFEALQKKLDSLENDTSVTVIFISDGQDNQSHNLQAQIAALKGTNKGMYLNFLCLGIGSGFPTFLSMELREKYHTGDATIPAIFLIEYIGEKAFLNKFESMKPYFTYNAKLSIFPAVIQYPWEEPKETVFENIWVLTEGSMLEVEGNIYDLSKDSTNLEGVVDIFKGWLQKIHLESLKPGKSDVKEMAVKALKMMTILSEQINKERGFDILNLKKDEEEPENITFHDRVIRNLMKHTLSRAAWYCEEIKLLAEGKSPSELNEYEAAKRIGIGTIVGKYHQKALALKGITVEDFKQIRNDFASTYSEAKLQPQSSQENSVFTLQNQKEVFLEKDFIEALNLCNNQFDLVECFPMIGMAIRIKRFNGSMVNPWLTKVNYIARHHKIVDTISIVKSSNNLELKVGDEVETINAVLPLFDKEDEDMKYLLRSKLYHLLMNFNVMQNVDTLYEDAYLALLSNTLVYLLNEEDSEWKKDLLNKIYFTVNMVYGEDQSFIKYREGLLNDPIKTISEDEELKKYGNIDLSKAILHLFMLTKDKLVDEKQSQHIIAVITSWYFYGMTKDSGFQLITYFKCKLVSDAHQKVIESVREDFKKFVTMGDLRREVYQAFDRIIAKEAQYDYSWEVKELYKSESKVGIQVIEKLSDLLLHKAPTKEGLIKYLGRAYISTSFSQMFLDSNIKLTVDDLTKTIGKKITIDTMKGGVKQLPACQIVIETLLKEFREWFKQIHFEIIPISSHELLEHCQKNKINKDSYHHLDSNGLIRNACLARGCPHFLKLNNHLGHHMDIWENDIPPAFHATVKTFANLPDEEIYDKFIHGKVIHGHGTLFEYEAGKFGRTKEQVIDYIKKVKTAFSTWELKSK